MVSPSSASIYDVFISYSRKDIDWVRDELLPCLEKASLKVAIDERDFQIGASCISNMVQAVTQSRHVLLVLTPESIASQWTEFETLVTLTRDPTGKQNRLFPVMLRQCELPQEIRHLTFADFTCAPNRSQQLARLLHQLGVPQKQITEVAAQSATQGLGALIQLMRTPAIKDAAGDVREVFRDAREQIDRLNRYKRLHDYFQRAEGLYNLVLQQKKMLKAKVGTWEELELPARHLDGEVQSLVAFARQVFPVTEAAWSHKLVLGQKKLLQAIDEEHQEHLEAALQFHHQVIGQVPPRLNAQLVEAAKTVPLQKLVTKLLTIKMRLDELQLDPTAGARLKQFAAGIEALEDLDRSLNVFVDNHNSLQAIDGELRLYDLVAGIQADQLCDVWMILKEMLQNLNDTDGTEWITPLQQTALQIDRYCGPAAVDWDLQTSKAVRGLFRDFWSKLTVGFNRVDADLLNFCDQLQQVGETLQQGLRSMQNGDD